MVNRKYNLIYADPPWAYKNKNTGGSMKSGAAAKYPTMTVEQICQLPISEIRDKDCILYLWATVPLMPEAFKVLSAWGFKYKTMITWRKLMSLGLGYWYRGQCEHLLVATRGKVKAFRMQVPNFHQSKAERHSQKPLFFRDLIEKSASKSFAEVRRLSYLLGIMGRRLMVGMYMAMRCVIL